MRVKSVKDRKRWEVLWIQRALISQNEASLKLTVRQTLSLSNVSVNVACRYL